MRGTAKERKPNLENDTERKRNAQEINSEREFRKKQTAKIPKSE